MIAITTSNSMSVNAEKNFFTWIFMWVFSSAGCSEGSHVSARALLRGLRGLCLGVLFKVGVGVGVVQRVLTLRCALSQSSRIKSTIIFYFLEGAADHRLYGFAQTMFNVESTETAFHLLLRDLRGEVLKNF